MVERAEDVDDRDRGPPQVIAGRKYNDVQRTRTHGPNDGLEPQVGSPGVNDLAEQFDATWLRFRAAVDDLGEAQMGSPTRVGWTAKEMLGHLGFWLEATEGVIVGMFRGEPLRDDFAFENYVDHMCTEFDAHLEELQDLLLTA